MTQQILVVGSYNVGLCTSGGRIPSPGETLMADRFFQVAGGKGSNQALAAARLGADVRFLAKVGDDDFGRAAHALYAAEGVPTETILVDSASHTGVGLVIVDDQGRNAISVSLGANDRLSPVDCMDNEQLFIDSSYILLQLETPMETVAKAVALGKNHGATVVLNPAPARELSAEILRGVDILTPNEHEAEELTGIVCDTFDGAQQAAQELRKRGVDKVIITLGERGCLLVDDEGSWHCDAERVNAVDTTGAGDSFNGALVAELATGADLRQSIKMANKVAAHCVQYQGVVEGLPRREAVTPA